MYELSRGMEKRGIHWAFIPPATYNLHRKQPEIRFQGLMKQSKRSFQTKSQVL
jgi:hypothetical protein